MGGGIQMDLKWLKTTTLFRLFLRYILIFCSVIVFCAMAFMMSFLYGINTGVILPANYSESELQSVESQLRESEMFDESLIPFSCTYILINQDGTLESSNMSEDEVLQIQKSLTEKPYFPSSATVQYKLINRLDGSSLLIKYDILAHFASPMLHNLFPKPELLIIVVLFILFILLTLIIALAFSKRLKIELVPIEQATTAIKEQDLHFEIRTTRIKEFNKVLQSMDELKIALTDSLKQQWEMEENKSNQIAALVHDIKTPLTIIKGNTELVLEGELAVQDNDLLENILHSSVKIESYIDLLMLATTLSNPAMVNKQLFSLPDFIMTMEKQGESLCRYKNIELIVERHNIPPTIMGDVTLIGRAVLNILDNAIEYAPSGSQIVFRITGKDDDIHFTVIDNGKGFSVEGLKNATAEFFTEKVERSGKHYGMGLYIVDSVAEKHGGKLLIANRNDTSGAVVTLIIKT